MHQLPITDPRWLEFVRSHADKTPFHDPSWASLLGDCYEMPVYALVSMDDASGKVQAGMPVAVAPRLVGRPHRLVSLPFTDSLPPLIDARDAATFVDAADEHRREHGFTRIELRGPLAGARPEPLAAVGHSLVLTPDADELLGRFSKGKRRDVRASERHGLTLRRAERERDVTETFYRLHVDTRRRHGVPVQPRRFFRLLWERILNAGNGFALIAEQAGTPVASAIFLVDERRIVYKYSASDVNRRSQLPNDLVIWSAIKEACLRGLSSMDFGRTELSAAGLRAFKSRWGALEEPLVYSTIGATSPHAHEAGATGLVGNVLRRSPRLLTRVAGELLYRYAA